MSDSTTNSSNPVGSIVGGVFLFLVPAILVVMLGIVGMAFIGGAGPKTDPAKAETAAVPAPAPVDPAPAPADPATAGTDTPPPAEPTAPATGETPSAGGEIDPAVMALGRTAYATCAACHGMDGKGLPAGPALMAPSLVGSEILLGDPYNGLLIVLKGIKKENMNFMGMMAPLGAALDDEKLAAVLTYTRNSWGNSAPAVTAEQAADARAKFGDVNEPAGVPRADIEKVVAAHK